LRVWRIIFPTSTASPKSPSPGRVTNVSQSGFLQYNDPGYWVFSQQIQDHVSWSVDATASRAGAIIGRLRYQDLSTPQCLYGA